MKVTFRPLPTWPHADTPRSERRTRSAFRAGWQSTMDLLEREVAMLAGRDVIVGAAFREQDLRIDGLPRSGAPQPPHPGVELSFDSIHGRLVYATDVCDFWQHNVRSIALGLEALRAVDRFGVSRRGEQYAGWLRLPAGATEDVERGRLLVEQHGGVMEALRATHPDSGGNARDFADVTAYRRHQGGQR